MNDGNMLMLGVPEMSHTDDASRYQMTVRLMCKLYNRLATHLDINRRVETRK